MTILFSLFFTLLNYGGLVEIDHEFHVSKCQITYAEKENSLHISLHVFIDDLEEALRQRGKDKLFLCTEKEAEDADQYIAAYLTDRLNIEVNQEEVSFDFIGKEVSEDLAAVWCYLEVTGVSELKSLKVQNKLLLETFEDQKNIISIKGPGGKKGFFLLQNGDDTDEVVFD